MGLARLRRGLRRFAVVFCGCVMLFVQSGSTVMAGAPAVATVSVEVAPNQVPADGVSPGVITVQVLAADGEPLTGMPVTFGTDFGTVQTPVTRLTDAAGGVTGAVYSTTAGQATVTATAGGVTGTATVTFYPPGPSGVRVWASTQAVPANGSAASTITAEVVYADGSPAEGVPVSFSTSLGSVGLPATKVTDAAGEVSDSVYSDVGGTAEVTVTTNNGVSGSTWVGFESLPVNPGNGSGAWVWPSGSGYFAVGSPTGATVMAELSDTNGKPLAGEPVQFSTNLGTLVDAQGVTDANGEVSATVYSGGPGSATVSAEAADGQAGSTTIYFVPPSQVSLSLTGPTQCVPTGGSGAVVTASAVDNVINSRWAPGIDGVPVEFQTSLGTVEPTEEVTAGWGGQVSAVVYSDTPGEAWVTAIAGGVSSTSYVVDFCGPSAPPMPEQVDEVQVSGASILVVPGGPMATTVTASVTGFNYQPLAGVPVTFGTDMGRVQPPVRAVTDAAGEVSAVVYGYQTGTAAVVTATADGVSGSTTVHFFSPDQLKLVVSSTMDCYAGGGSCSLSAYFVDSQGNQVALSGIPITFQANFGVLATPSTLVTNGSGSVYAQVYSQVPGTATVTAASLGGLSATDTIQFLSGQPTHLWIWSSVNSAPADGQTAVTITAQVVDEGWNPVAGVPVTFSTDLGALSGPSSQVTNAAGDVSVAVYSDTAGMASVTAVTAAGISATTTVSFLTTGVAGVQVKAVPSSIPAGAGTSAEVTAQLVGGNGSPVQEAGVPVTFETNFGAFAGAAAGVTNAAGQVSAAVYSVTPGAATVTATADGKSAETVITFYPAQQLSLLLWATRWVAPTGNGATQVVARAMNDDGEPVAGVPVDFRSNLGGFIGPSTGLTNAYGEVTAEVYSLQEGMASVMAMAEGATAVVANITYYQPTLSSIQVWASPGSLPAGGAAVTVMAQATDQHGNPMVGELITFSTDLGGFQGAASGVTNSDGLVSVAVYSPVAGTAAVTAAGGGQSGSVTVDFYTPGPTGIKVWTSQQQVPAGGSSTAVATALVVNGNGQPLAGVPVTFSINYGSVSAPSTDLTNAAGEVSTVVYAPASGVAAMVTATTGNGKSATTPVLFYTPTVASLQVSGQYGAVPANGQSTGSVYVQVLDQYDNPVSGVPVSFSTSLGKLSALSEPTDGTGDAVVTLTSATPGTAVVTASVGDKSGTALVTFSSSVPQTPRVAGIAIWANPQGVPADGTSTATLMVNIWDQNYEPIGDMPVVLSTNLGTLSSDMATTNAFGQAQVTIASSTGGTATVTAMAGGFQGYGWVSCAWEYWCTTAEVDFYTPGRTHIELTGAPSYVQADGSSTSTVTARVVDWNGNPVVGVPVTFRTDLGVLGAPTTALTNSWGEVSDAIYSRAAGVAEITATSLGVQPGLAAITFYPLGAVGNIQVQALPAHVPLGGQNVSRVSALITNQGGSPVAGVPVTFSTSLGSIVGPTTAVSSADGMVSAVVYSATAGTAVVTATAGGETGTGTVVFYQAVPHQVLFPQEWPMDYGSGVADGTQPALVSAQVLDQYGKPLAGVPVTFSAAFGTVGQTRVYSDSSGEVYDAVYSLQTGSDPITATTANGMWGTSSVWFSAPPQPPGALGGVEISAQITNCNSWWWNCRPVIPANGVDTATVNVQLVDANGNWLGQGIPVVLTTDFGELGQPTTTVTNYWGQVSDTVYSTTAGTATVTATAGGKSASVQITFYNPTVPSTVTVNTPYAAAEGTPATVSAEVLDAQGDPIPGVPVTFGTNFGTLGPQATAITNIDGEVTTTIYSVAAGTATVTAATPEGVSGRGQIIFYHPQVQSLGIGASPGNVVADGRSGAVVTVQVWDQNYNSLAGIPVDIRTNLGVLSSSVVTTNDQGQAQVEITSTVSGQATVMASVYNGISESTTVNFYRPVATSLWVGATPPSVPADGRSTATVTAQVMDQQGNPLAGVPVFFSTDLGSFATAAEGITDAAGEVAVAVYSNTAGTATVMAQVNGGPSDTVQVTFTVSQPTNVQVWASPANVPADGSSVATVTAQVKNATGAPLAGVPVTFGTNLGGLVGQTVLTTGGNGEVSTAVYSYTAGTATVTAMIYGGISDSTAVIFWPTSKYLLFTSDAGKATGSVWGKTLPGDNCPGGGCGSTVGYPLPWTFAQVTFLVNQPAATGDVYIVGDAAANYNLRVSFTCGPDCIHNIQGSFVPGSPGTVIDMNNLAWFNEGGGQGRTVTISLIATGADYGVGNIYLYATGGDQLYDLSASAAPMVQPGSAQGTVGQEVGIPLEVQSAPLPMNSITVDNGAAVSFDPSILKLDAVSGGPGTSVQWSNITASNLTFALSAPVGLTAGTQAATLDFTCLAPGTSVVTLNGGQYTTPEPWWSSSGLSQASGQITCTAPGTPIGISGFTPGAVPQATPGSDVPVNMTITGWGLNTVRSVELVSQDGGPNVAGSVVAAAVYTGSVGVTFGGVPLGAYKVEVTGAGGDVAQSTGEFLVAPGIPMFSVTQQAFWSMAPGATYTHTWIVSNQGLVPGVALVMVRFPNGVSATACPNTDVLYYANGAALVAVPVAAESSTTFCFQEVLPPSQVQYPGQPSNPGSANVPINSEQSTNTLLVGSLTQQQWNGLQGQPTAEILAQGLVDTTNADGQYAQEIGQMPDAEAFTTALYGSLPGFSPSYGVVNGTADINSSSFLWNAPSGQDAQYFILGLLLEYIATFVPPSNGEMPSISELGIETIMDFGKSVGLQTISSVLDNQYFGAGETFGLKLATIISCVGALIPELTMFLLAPCIMGVVDLIVASMDPNSLAAAPPGAGSENYVLNGQTLGVQVHFENSPKANAPAQNVRVDVQLGQNLDPASVRLVYYTTSTPPVISVTPAGLVRFYFNNLDLPPDVNPPAGEDMVEFTVSPRPDLADNAPLTVSGNVYFDYNPPVATQVLTYHIDAVNPVASVAPLPGVSPANFVVNWSGTDPGGPGIQGYTVLVSVNGGPYQTWQSDTTITSAVYDGQPGNTYSFVALAQDLLGQTQAMPSQAQASTTVAVVAGGGSGGSNGGGSAPVTVPAAAMSVGSAGGTVSAADGAVVVDVPPGAFTSMTSVQVTALPTSQDHEPPGKSFVGASPQWTISAGGAEPAKPVLATFRYDPGALGGLSPRRLGVYGYDPGKGAWQWVGGRVYAADDTVSAELPSFGTYAVFADVATFKDMGQASWARDAVDTLLGANMVVGMAPGVFEPNGLLTRAQFATLLVKADGLAPQRFTPTPFTDVAPTAWYAPYVAAAYRAGLVAGVGSGSFAPDAPVTREEMAVMLSKAILEDDGSHSLARFSDAGSVASWARAGVEAVVGAGIMTGFPDGTFRPRSVATRAQAAAVVASYLGYAGKA